jgi:hypothetical protein
MYKGKWWRYELVVRTAGTGVTTIEIYRKNVTDNGPDEKVIDTVVPTSQPVGQSWTSAQATSLRPSAAARELWFDLFRRDTCTGFAAMSHIMAASWSTDAGQRIGAALEIEGGSGAPVPPAGAAPSAPSTPTFR